MAGKRQGSGQKAQKQTDTLIGGIGSEATPNRRVRDAIGKLKKAGKFLPAL
jgi:hypothetical protein